MENDKDRESGGGEEDGGEGGLFGGLFKGWFKRKAAEAFFLEELSTGE